MEFKFPFFALTLASLMSLASCGGNNASSSTLSYGSDSVNSEHSNGTSNSKSSFSTSEWVSMVMPETEDIMVMCAKNTGYTHVYAWITDTQKLAGEWPGTQMESYDDNWYSYRFSAETPSFNVIFNNGSSNSQTDDLKEVINGAGWYWYTRGEGFFASNAMPNPGSGKQPSADMKTIEGPGAYEGGTDNAADYTDFTFWNEYPSSYWTTISKYNGSRKDFRQESIYFAVTTRFYNGDTSNDADCWDGYNVNGDSDPAWRGDFKGLIEKMDYIKALGFTAIWITPIVSNSSGYDYHGYHGNNFRKVDKRYLSEDVDFQDVINAAHARDMKIVLDVVWNHTGNWGEENLFPMFIKDDEADPDSINDVMQLNTNGPLYQLHPEYSNNNNNAFQLRCDTYADNRGDPGDIYHHKGAMGNWEEQGAQEASIAGDCVDLNTENPRVAEYIVDSYGKFIRMGVDAFRIDTMVHISRLTLNKYFFPAIQEYARRCRGDDNFFMFGEVCARVTTLYNHDRNCITPQFYTWKERNNNYAWGDKDTNLASARQHWADYADASSDTDSSNNCYLDGMNYHTPNHSRWSGSGVIDFRMHRNFGKIDETYQNCVNDDYHFNDATYNVVYVDSHDYSPEVPDENVRPPYSDAEWAEKLNLMFTFRGIPCIYYGTEAKFAAGNRIDNGFNSPLSQTGRAYFGDYLEGDVTANGFGNVGSASGAVSDTLNSNLAKHIRMLNKIRLACPALQMGQYKSVGNKAFVKRYTAGGVDSVACVVINGGAQFSGLPNGTYVDLVTGDTKTGTSFYASATGQSNLRVYVLNGTAIGGSPLAG